LVGKVECSFTMEYPYILLLDMSVYLYGIQNNFI